MPIHAMHKELLVHMSLFLGNEDHRQLSCTAKPFKNLDVEKVLCSESVTIDHSLLMKIRCYHYEIIKNQANGTRSSTTSSEQTDNNFDTSHYQSKKPRKTNTPNAEQQATESNATAIKKLTIAYNAAEHLTNDDLVIMVKLGFIHEKIDEINLLGCRQITDLNPLTSCTALEKLSLRNCTQITDQILSTLPVLPALTKLTLNGCDQITDLSPLASCTALTSLNLWNCHQITDIGPLASYTALTSLNLEDCDQITDLSPLQSCMALKALSLSGCNQITDQILSTLPALHTLKSLELSFCSKITDQILSTLPALHTLKSLDLSCCSQITDLRPLASYTTLTSLDLGYCSQITDQILSTLPVLPELTHLDLEDCDQITDLSHLANHPSLSKLIGPDGEKADLTSLSNTQQPGP